MYWATSAPVNQVKLCFVKMINKCSNHYQFEPSTAQIYCINGVSPKNIDISNAYNSCKMFSFFSFCPDFCINLNSRVTDKLCICRNTQMFYKSSKTKSNK